jgi:hypothetical protein
MVKKKRKKKNAQLLLPFEMCHLQSVGSLPFQMNLLPPSSGRRVVHMWKEVAWIQDGSRVLSEPEFNKNPT